MRASFRMAMPQSQAFSGFPQPPRRGIPAVSGLAQSPAMSMIGEYLRVTAAELDSAIRDPDWALDFVEEVRDAEEEAEPAPAKARHLRAGVGAPLVRRPHAVLRGCCQDGRRDARLAGLTDEATV
ncbi:DUF1877 family protein [Streptomyces sp. NPDC029044]|uniref:DUF1877 family protein n=1 Tax=Streptomyces sp. NPDC029044 TaxID=3157198 RepID=UPI0033EEEF1B